MQVSHWKFSSTATDSAPAIGEPKAFLNRVFSTPFYFGQDNIKSTGFYRLSGWAYDLRPYLKKILVKQYGSWQEYYAPNKTVLRKVLFGRIEKMQYLD